MRALQRQFLLKPHWWCDKQLHLCCFQPREFSWLPSPPLGPLSCPASVPCSAPPSSEPPAPVSLLLLSKLPALPGSPRCIGKLCWRHSCLLAALATASQQRSSLSSLHSIPGTNFPPSGNTAVHKLLKGLCSLFWEVQYKCFRLRKIKAFPSKPVTLRPHGLWHARVPCPSPTPGAYSDSCPSSW